MQWNSRIGRRLSVVAVVSTFGFTACSSAGDMFGGLAGNTVSGEVRGLDRSWLQVRDENSGRTESLRYDGRTRVVYQNRDYAVSALERGDIVSVRVEQDRNGQRWAERVDVRQSVSDRGYGQNGGVYDRNGNARCEGNVYDPGSVRCDDDRNTRDVRYARTTRLDGTIAQVDYRRGAFVLQQSRNAAYTVYVPNNLNRDEQRRFERLRRGDRARVEVRPLNRNQYELVRFR